MADQNAKRYFIRMELCTGKFLGSLIMNLNTVPKSEITNPDWQIKMQKNYLFWIKAGTREFF